MLLKVYLKVTFFRELSYMRGMKRGAVTGVGGNTEKAQRVGIRIICVLLDSTIRRYISI